MDIEAGGYNLTNLDRINVVLGKNGSGKSTLLKAVEAALNSDGQKKYITPERGGALDYEPHIEQSLTSNLQWLSETRRVNQFGQFRQQSVAQFRRLELAVFRASEKKGIANFDPYIERLNSLLDHIEVRRVDPTDRTPFIGPPELASFRGQHYRRLHRRGRFRRRTLVNVAPALCQRGRAADLLERPRRWHI